MKRLICAFIMLAVLLCGCAEVTPSEEPSVSASASVSASVSASTSVSTSATATQSATLTDTPVVTITPDATGTPVITVTPDATGTPVITVAPSATPGKPEVITQIVTAPKGGFDAYADNDGYNVNYLCGIDGFGRVFKPIAGMDDGKDVGMFYFLWHGESGKNSFNITEQLQNDRDTLYDLSINTDKFHYWGEPLFGYYRSSEKWVIARHIEMLVSAGVDYLVFDTTNGFEYKRSYSVVLEMLTQYQQDGWDVPRFVFYTNSYSLNVIKKVYDDIYVNGRYKSLWYCPDGNKPMIIGVPDDPNFTGDKSFLSFFDLRISQWPDAAYNPDGIPWMEWRYPQPIHNDGFINVSVAQHPQLPFSASITDRSRNWGRGYNFTTKKNVEADSRKGTNFQSQWDTVHANKDKVQNVFVTGWNEWIAQKLNINNELYFVDCATEEFSRDIEPMKGGYEDNFYLQLCDNVRRFKANNGALRAADTGVVNINKDASQWDGVRNVYNAISQSVMERNSKSIDRKYTYVQDAPKNNIQQVKLLNNEDTLYFLIKTEGNMVDTSAADFMDIYLGIGDLELKGWNGYELVISCGERAVFALDGNAKRTKVGSVDISVKNNALQLAVSLDSISARGADGIYFKVCSGVSSSDIMDTYLQGKSLPMGRLSYYYYFG